MATTDVAIGHFDLTRVCASFRNLPLFAGSGDIRGQLGSEMSGLARSFCMRQAYMYFTGRVSTRSICMLSRVCLTVTPSNTERSVIIASEFFAVSLEQMSQLLRRQREVTVLGAALNFFRSVSLSFFSPVCAQPYSVVRQTRRIAIAQKLRKTTPSPFQIEVAPLSIRNQQARILGVQLA
jgi:hypothetical protein